MTLVTRLIFPEKIVVAVDNQSNDPTGYPFYNGRTGKPMEVNKLVACPRQNAVIGVSGFLAKQDFNLLDTLRELSASSETDNINDLMSELIEKSRKFPSQSFQDGESILLGAGHSKNELLAPTFEKRGNEIKLHTKTISRSPNLDQTTLKKLCSKFSVAESDILGSYDENKLTGVLDFNFNYTKNDFSRVSNGPFVFYNIFHFFSTWKLGLNYIFLIRKMQADDLTKFLEDFYLFLKDIPDYDDPVLVNFVGIIRTIGPCSDVVVITKEL